MGKEIENESILLKEVDIIQNIIKRMGYNSFLIKGWTVTLVVATLLLKSTDFMILISFIPLIVFWFLDAYFLQQERLYRMLYKWVINNRPQTTEFFLDMNTMRFKKDVQNIPRIMFSITLGLFYGAIAVLITIYSILLLLLPT